MLRLVLFKIYTNDFFNMSPQFRMLQFGPRTAEVVQRRESRQYDAVLWERVLRAHWHHYTAYIGCHFRVRCEYDLCVRF